MSDLCVTHAKGSYVYTADGQKYLDYSAGFGVVNTGHCHPEVVKAIQEQVRPLCVLRVCACAANVCVSHVLRAWFVLSERPSRSRCVCLLCVLRAYVRVSMLGGTSFASINWSGRIAW